MIILTIISELSKISTRIFFKHLDYKTDSRELIISCLFQLFYELFYLRRYDMTILIK